MAVNDLQERIKSGELQWLIYLSIGLILAGIVLLAIGLVVIPGPLLLVGLAVGGLGIWLFRYIFDKRPHSQKNRKRLPKAMRTQVWRAYNGDKIDSQCFVCTDDISIDNFEVGHNRAIAKGGTDTIGNLRSICGKCNKAMGTESITSYKRRYTRLMKQTGRNRKRSQSR